MRKVVCIKKRLAKDFTDVIDAFLWKDVEVGEVFDLTETDAIFNKELHYISNLRSRQGKTYFKLVTELKAKGI